MNRRAFITGLIASTALASNPIVIEAVLAASPEVDYKIYIEKWVKDVSSVFAECHIDLLLYGTMAHEHCDTYPYIRRVDPATLHPPTRLGGLFDR